MTPERRQQINEVFLTALELEAQQRASFLDQACVGDPLLRHEVSLLIESDQQATEFFEQLDQIRDESLSEIVSVLQPGDALLHYRVIRKIGQGGMGEVYQAEDLKLRRPVALKLLPAAIAEDEKFKQRLLREARSASNLNHPNIVTIYSIEESEGLDFIVMEYVEGNTLRARLKSGPLELSEMLEVGLQVTEALAAAHSIGLVHRDIKPENILMAPTGQAKVLDFGVAKRMISAQSEADHLTGPGVIAGTVSYMSPEQTRGEAPDVRSDIFSLGCVLYEAATGKAPFQGPNVLSILHAIGSSEAPPPPSSLRSGLPRELDVVLRNALAKEKEQRYSSASELKNALRDLRDGNVSNIRPVSPGLLTRVRPAIWVVFMAVLLLAGALWFSPGRDSSIHSVAVLPFTNASVNPNVQYLSDELTESIINDLSQLPEVRVMARGTVFIYKGKEMDPRKLGRELNVDAVITGRIIQHGDVLVFHADMVNVADGRQLWGQQYVRKMSDVLALQSDISGAICTQLRSKLQEEKKK